MTLFEHAHQRQHRRHDPPPPGEIAVTDAGVVEREMFMPQRVGAAATPEGRVPGEEFERLIIHAAAHLDIRVVAGQTVNAVDVARAFLDPAETAAAAHAVKKFLAHYRAGATGEVVEHHRQVCRTVDGQRIEGVLAIRWHRIGRAGQKDGIGAHVAGSPCEGDEIAREHRADALHQRHAPLDPVVGEAGEIDTFLNGLGIVLAGGAARDYAMHAAAITRAIERMRETIEEPLSPAQIAGEIGISTCQLERLFGKFLNTSSKKYFMELRLERARHLLIQTEASVIEIALACGFESSGHFSRVYRAANCVAPMQQRGRLS